MSQADVDLRDEHCLYVKRSYATSLLMYMKRILSLVIKKPRLPRLCKSFFDTV